jgi:hypothetical protein
MPPRKGAGKGLYYLKSAKKAPGKGVTPGQLKNKRRNKKKTGKEQRPFYIKNNN